MGREIRRVPQDWQHPKEDYGGHYKPLYDGSFKEHVQEWVNDFQEFIRKFPSGLDEDGDTFEEYNGAHPVREEFRPDWNPEEATAYQIYENVSEGTPVSPVFATEAEMRQWLLDEWGLSEKAADNFIELGFSFSMIGIGGKLHGPGPAAIEAMAQMDEPE